MIIAICDDEIKDLNIIKNYVSKYNSSFSIFCFISSTELLQSINTHSFDLIFLDIEMDTLNGYETAKIIRNQNNKTIIVFTTNSLDYSIRGYGIAFRYLPKPISYQLFCKTMSQVEKIIFPQKIEICTSDNILIVNISDIIYFESYGHNIVFHLSNNTEIKSRSTIKDILKKIPSSSIVQMHKSFCVNLDYVVSTTSTSVQLKNGISLPIGRKKRDEFRNLLQNYIRES